MVEIKKCLDTYALVEIANENQKFIKYLNSDLVITDLTLVEFYSVLLREEDERVADYWFKKLENYSLSLDKETLIEAIKFRHVHKNKLTLKGKRIHFLCKERLSFCHRR